MMCELICVNFNIVHAIKNYPSPEKQCHTLDNYLKEKSSWTKHIKTTTFSIGESINNNLLIGKKDNSFPNTD